MLRDFPVSFRTAVFAFAFAAALGASALVGCGIKGPLKPAPPPVKAADTPPAEPATVPAPTPAERKP